MCVVDSLRPRAEETQQDLSIKRTKYLVKYTHIYQITNSSAPSFSVFVNRSVSNKSFKLALRIRGLKLLLRGLFCPLDVLLFLPLLGEALALPPPFNLFLGEFFLSSLCVCSCRVSSEEDDSDFGVLLLYLLLSSSWSFSFSLSFSLWS